MNQLGAVERRRRNLRIVLFAIILGTLPLYCLGFLLWGTAPNQNARTPTSAATTAVVTLQATATSNVLFPSLTPFQFPTQIVPTYQFPTAIVPTYQFPTSAPFPTFVVPTATNFVFPTATIAPTLTLIPSETPPPTATFLPTFTDTQIPVVTDTTIPILTDTPTPTPTETPSETPIPP